MMFNQSNKEETEYLSSITMCHLPDTEENCKKCWNLQYFDAGMSIILSNGYWLHQFWTPFMQCLFRTLLVKHLEDDPAQQLNLPKVWFQLGVKSHNLIGFTHKILEFDQFIVELFLVKIESRSTVYWNIRKFEECITKTWEHRRGTMNHTWKNKKVGIQYHF